MHRFFTGDEAVEGFVEGPNGAIDVLLENEERVH